MPDALDAELRWAHPELADPPTPTLRSVTRPGFTCPECHGALWEIDDGALPRFRCRVGHGFSADSLLVNQRGDVEAALWMAYRALEERAALCRGLAERARSRSAAITAEHFRVEADEMASQAELLRSLLRSRAAASAAMRKNQGPTTTHDRRRGGKSVMRANDQDDNDEPAGDGPAEQTTLTSVDRDDFERLLEYLKRSRGFDFTGYKRASLVRRVSSRMKLVGIDTFPGYLDFLQVDPDEFTALFDAILINVTGFCGTPRRGSCWRRMCSRGSWPPRAHPSRSGCGAPAVPPGRRPTPWRSCWPNCSGSTRCAGG